MFSNPLGSVFNKPDGEEKKKKRNKKTKKLSPELSEESMGSKTDLTAGGAPDSVVEVEAAPAAPSLLDIVSEINSSPVAPAAEVAEEPVAEVVAAPVEEEQQLVAPVEEEQQVVAPVEEQVETQYEELPVEESTMKTIIESIHNFTRNSSISFIIDYSFLVQTTSLLIEIFCNRLKNSSKKFYYYYRCGRVQNVKFSLLNLVHR